MKVLIVEDENKIANSIKKGLEQEKYIVDVVYDGIEGFDLATSETYDVIVLDRMLPGMEGVALTKRLREKNIHTPILMLTARVQIDDKVEGLDTGADDYMTKPFSFTELLARLRALVRRPKQTVEAVMTVANLSIDTSRFEVVRNKKIIPLTSKEFSLLVYLARHQNTIVTKEQIVNNVWNYDANVLPNSVEVYIKHLRNKIDDKQLGKPLIHTVRGFGYKLGEK